MRHVERHGEDVASLNSAILRCRPQAGGLDQESPNLSWQRSNDVRSSSPSA